MLKPHFHLATGFTPHPFRWPIYLRHSNGTASSFRIPTFHCDPPSQNPASHLNGTYSRSTFNDQAPGCYPPPALPTIRLLPAHLSPPLHFYALPSFRLRIQHQNVSP
ncbi:hypothetical protein K443DRAFT_13161 [Laccaria amethystina LaAM-08-1]|uniref:Uncharacterized protein n=1 Tax=Laccaria amethystina LaAM-08-1 TaxID=1095629 RepID=A0A0C9WIJ6_9AGAR|nr:hypothetical protein K443DRAFT_13161 [Laccaria amethystina LaAM-08-1]